MADRARRATSFPTLKIKVGGASDLATLEAVRAVYDGPLRVDANTGWLPDEGARLLPELGAGDRTGTVHVYETEILPSPLPVDAAVCTPRSLGKAALSMPESADFTCA